MNCDVLTSESPFFLLNKNINFDKNETESKMENLTEPCASAHKESRMKSKTVMNWSSRKKKNVFFVTSILSEGKFFNTCVSSRHIVY